MWNSIVSGPDHCLFIYLSLKKLLQQCISEPEFYGGLVHRFRKHVGKSKFSGKLKKLINHYKRIGYNLDITM